MKKISKFSNKNMRGGTPKSSQRGNMERFPKQSKEKILELTLIKSYPRQVVCQLWLPLVPGKLTTTITSGLIAAGYLVNLAGVNNFVTRFGATFVEYRIIKAVMNLRMFSSTNPGVIQAWYDEKSTAGPTLAEAQERYIQSVNASAVDERPSLKWTASDPLDLQYTAIGTTVTPVTYKYYTNNANFGSSVVATDYFEIEGAALFQFRGLL